MLFSGPPRYEAHSPWTPSAAMLAALAASFAPAVAVLVAMQALPEAAPAGPAAAEGTHAALSLSTASGLAIAIGAQLASLALIWLAAGFRSLRREVLQLAGPAPAVGTLLLGGLIVVAATGVLEVLLHLTSGFDIRADSQLLLEGLAGPYWPGTLVVGVVLAPLWEELVYRGFLLSALAKTRLGFAGAAVLANVPWTLLHAAYSWQGLASVFTAGLVLSWLLWRTGSIWAPIAAHALVNACAVTFIYALGNGS